MTQAKTKFRPSPTAILNPRCDPIFKAIFTQGTKESDLALSGLISAAIGKKVTELTLQPNELPVDIPDNMQMSFDVSVVFNDGERADIELQGRQYDYDYGARAEIQTARLLNLNARKGSNWHVEKVYQISVVNFEFDKDDNSTLSWYTMKNDSGGRLGDRLNVIFLDLVKIRRLKGISPEKLSPIEKWGMFFAFADDPNLQDYLEQVKMSEEDIMAADLIVKTMSEEDANWALENSYYIAQNDYGARMEAAEKKGLERGLEKGQKIGLERGLEKGQKIGLEKGQKIGRETGLKEGRAEAALNIAKNALSLGLSAEQVVQMTALPLSQVLALSEELKTKELSPAK